MMKTSQPAIQSVLRFVAKPAVFLLVLPLLAIPAIGQAIPAAEASPISTGFALPSVAGTLQYAVSASQSLTWGYYGNSGVASATNLTGDLAYISNSKLYPFSMVFSGGHSWATSGEPSYSFVNLAMSQVIAAHRWNFVLSDAVSYMPGTPTTGLSGVPGVGDLGPDPVQVGADTGQGVLTDFSTRVSNTAALSVERQLTGKTSLNASGSYSISRFLSDTSSSGSSNNPGLDNDSESGSLGLSHRIDARNNLGGNYSYSNFTYSGNNYGIAEPGFSSQTASLQYTHQFSRKLSTSLAAGPQWSSIDSSGSSRSLSLFASLSATYAGQLSHASLAYSRSSNSGYGVVGGAISDSVNFSAGRTFNRVWLCTFTSAYTQSSNLPSAGSLPFTFHTTVAGGQISRAIGRSLSTYASYTLQNQSNQGSAATIDLFSGLSQVAGFGLTFSPSSIHHGHQ
jgi:hypothetical protein